MKKIITIVTVIAVIAILGCVLCACAPKDTKAATEKMQKQEYTVVNYTSAMKIALAVLSDVNIDGAILATNGDETVTAILCSSTKDAKAVYDWCKDEDGKTDVKKSGKWVYYGSAAGMKAFTK